MNIFKTRRNLKDLVRNLLINAEKLPEENEGVPVGQTQPLHRDHLAQGDHLEKVVRMFIMIIRTPLGPVMQTPILH